MILEQLDQWAHTCVWVLGERGRISIQVKKLKQQTKADNHNLHCSEGS